MKICPKCGTEVEKRFCPDCGTEYVESVEAEVVEVPEAESTAEEAAGEPVEEASYEVRQEIVPVPRYEEKKKPSGGRISAKSTGIIAYITWIGMIIALLMGDKQGGKFHLNQALVIKAVTVALTLVASWVPVIGGLVAFVGIIFCYVCWGLGLYYAITEQEKEVPLLGQIRLL